MVLFPLPAHRTGRADFPHPALGESSRFRPRKAGGPFGKTDQTKHLVERCRRKTFLPRPPHFVLDAQPLTQPLAGVLIYRTVGLADWAEAEVICPSGVHLVELFNDYRGIQRGFVSSGFLAD